VRTKSLHYDVLGSSKQLKHSLERHVVSVSVGSTPEFHHYAGGIFNGPCLLMKNNHGVAAIGYGPDYWLIRNSWGSEWGEGGYIRVNMNDGSCGIL
jgi:hypothetical protein